MVVAFVALFVQTEKGRNGMQQQRPFTMFTAVHAMVKQGNIPMSLQS